MTFIKLVFLLLLILPFVLFLLYVIDKLMDEFAAKKAEPVTDGAVINRRKRNTKKRSGRRTRSGRNREKADR